MSYNKSQIATIAFRAWAMSYEDDVNVNIKIDGDKNVILPFLRTLAAKVSDKMSLTLAQVSYVESLEFYLFSVEERDVVQHDNYDDLTYEEFYEDYGLEVVATGLEGLEKEDQEFVDSVVEGEFNVVEPEEEEPKVKMIGSICWENVPKDWIVDDEDEDMFEEDEVAPASVMAM